MKKTVPPANKPLPALIGAAAQWGAAQLADGGGGEPRAHAQEARALLLDALGLDEYAALPAKSNEPLPPAAAARYRESIAARRAGQPVAYILGWREFYGRRFKTTPAALIPRPDTETLVEAALAHVPKTGARALDLGAGCGAIGISVALHRPRSAVTLTDVSEQTLALARENAGLHGVSNVRFVCGDWYAPLAALDARPYDVIICNPPYVAADDHHLRQGDLRFEPPLALIGGRDGLAALEKVIGDAPARLRRGGVLLVEHGCEQAAAVRAQFAGAGFCGAQTLHDLAARPRVTLAVKP